MDSIDSYPNCDMKLSQAQKIFEKPFVNQLNRILINGNYGDFITAQDGLEIVEYFRNTNPSIRIEISTNASGRPNIWSRLGELGTRVYFRLDGLKDTHTLYRQDTDFDLIITNAQKFIQAGGYAIWAYIPFDHNKHQIAEAKALATALGFKEFQIVDAGRNIGPVFDRSKNYSHSLGNYSGSTNYEELYSQYLYYVEKPEVTILTNKHSNRKINCYAKNNNEIYIAANGEVFPCCWLGFYPKYGNGNPSNMQLRPLITKNNALEYRLETCIEWFNKVEKSWNFESVGAGKIYTCNETCGAR